MDFTLSAGSAESQVRCRGPHVPQMAWRKTDAFRTSHRPSENLSHLRLLRAQPARQSESPSGTGSLQRGHAGAGRFPALCFHPRSIHV